MVPFANRATVGQGEPPVGIPGEAWAIAGVVTTSYLLLLLSTGQLTRRALRRADSQNGGRSRNGFVEADGASLQSC